MPRPIDIQPGDFFQLKQAALDESLHGLAICERDGRVIYVNQAFLDLFGLQDESEALNRPLAAFWEPSEQAQAMAVTVKAKGRWEGEIVARRRSAAPCIVQVAARLVADSQGQPRWLAASFIDITEHVQAARILERANRELDLFRRLTEASGQAIGYASLDGRILYANPRLLEYLALPEGDRPERHTVFEFYRPADQTRLRTEILTSVLRDGQWTGEIDLCGQDGRCRPTIQNIFLLRDELGQPVEIANVITDITHHRQREARLRAIYDSAREGIVVARADTRAFVMANPAFCKMFGYGEDEVLGLTPSALHPAEVLPRVEAHFADMARGQLQVNEETPCLRKDGRLFHADISVAPMQIDGRLHFVCFYRDVSERRRYRLALEKSEANLKEAQRLAHIGSWELDLVTGELTWSDEIYRIFEIDPARFGASYEAFLEAIHPEDRDFVNARYTESVKNRTPYDIVHRLLMPDGRIKYVRERCETHYDASGRPIRSVGTVQDITERELNRLALERLNRELEQRVAERTQQIQEQAAIIDQIHDAILTLDLAGEIETWNLGAEKMFGYAASEVRGQPLAVLVAATEREQLDKRLFMPLLYAGRHEAELCLLRKDGSRFEGLLSLSMLSDAQGKPRGMAVYIIDISLRKKAELALRAAKEAAERASRMKSEFLASMSHELRTPLNAILGFAELLGMSPNLSEDDRLQAEEITRAGRHLLQLINDVLDLAKIEAGQLGVEIQPVALAETLEECRSQLEHKAREHGIGLSLDPGLAKIHVLADPIRLRQVLLNLLSNAVKYNRPGGSVQVAAEPLGSERVRVRVSDTGPGISEARQAQLFTLFNRLGREGGNIQGTGIGLVISKRLTEMMGGSIGLESVEGQGSTFWVELPLAKDGAAHAPAPVAEVTPEVQALDSRTLLYVEDTPSNVRLLEKVLARRPGIRLLVAKTAAAGLALAQRERPDLILLDIDLPDMDGYSLHERLRNDARTATIPVVALTAMAMKGDAERALSAGFDAYLSKPLDIPRFYQLLDDYLDDFGTARPGQARG